MTLLLAPYNSAMQLGQGFNSYTHELCIDGAVIMTGGEPLQANAKTSTSQVVTYSSRCVEKLSDVLNAMNISYSSSIKKGTVEISGNTNSVDEATFKDSDLNAVVSVKVVNQTVLTPKGAEFQEIDGIVPGSEDFNRVYGDSYISGFLEGGDFTGIISIKVLDRSKTKETVERIKNGIGLLNSTNTRSGNDAKTVVNFKNDVVVRIQELTAETECSISVSWRGGGQVKEEGIAWDLKSMYAAAAAFPARVASTPQKTWAILTKYKANRTFIKQAKASVSKSLEYDQISGYTAELFDSFMDYKLLLGRIQYILKNRKDYQSKLGVVNAIDPSMSTLLSVRTAFREEQTKIKEAIDVLSRDPGILDRRLLNSVARRNPLIDRIIRTTIGSRYGFQGGLLGIGDTSGAAPPNRITIPAELLESAPVVIPATAEGPVETPADSEASPPEENGEEGTQPPVEGENSENPASGPVEEQPPAPPTVKPAPPPPSKIEVVKQQDFDFDSLVPPEVWEDLMPEPIPGTPSALRELNTKNSTLPSNVGLGGALGPQNPPGWVNPDIEVSKSKDQLTKELEEAKAEALRALKAADKSAEEASRAKAARDALNNNLSIKITAAEQARDAMNQEVAKFTDLYRQGNQEISNLNNLVRQKDAEIGLLFSQKMELSDNQRRLQDALGDANRAIQDAVARMAKQTEELRAQVTQAQQTADQERARRETIENRIRGLGAPFAMALLQ